MARPPLRGQLRIAPEPMQIVSGKPGRYQVHYEAPPADKLPEEMSVYFSYPPEALSSQLQIQQTLQVMYPNTVL